MKITKVVNKYKAPYDVYIGRGSIWGNPFPVKEYGRAKCIQMFEELMDERIMSDASYWIDELKKLKGKTLGCFCKPQPCHGDVLARLVQRYVPDELS